MKNNILKIGIISLFIFVFCTACNGTITRNIRHGGFSISNKFVCEGFFPENKEDTSYKKIRYITSNHLIDQDGKIYEISLGQPFANNQNCKMSNASFTLKAILDDNIAKGTDNKYYYLNGQNDVAPYTEIPETDNSYEIYDLLLKDPDVIKVITADSSIGKFYLLKTDGNVYSYTISRTERDKPATITSISRVYEKELYGANIVDFNYAGDSLTTFIKTDFKLFRMQITNVDKCKKYADITCNYKIQEDMMFEENRDYIIAYNGNLLITNYGQIFTVSN